MSGKRLTSIFVTGTDTNVGKTLVTGLLARFFLAKGADVTTQKWVQTGCDDFDESDVKTHLNIMNKSGSPLPEQIPYCFKMPYAPHLAAGKENIKINIEKIKSDFEHLKQNHDSVIVEGAGGVCIPMTKDNMVMDLVVRLQIPVVVVVSNKLGSINHALLTVEYLRMRKIKTIGLIFNNTKDVPVEVAQDNPRIIGEITNYQILGTLPFDSNIEKVNDSFSAIGEKIWRAIQR